MKEKVSKYQSQEAYYYEAEYEEASEPSWQATLRITFTVSSSGSREVGMQVKDYTNDFAWSGNLRELIVALKSGEKVQKVVNDSAQVV